jgi:hypothetical protein
MKDRCVYADKDVTTDPAAVENRSVTDMNIIIVDILSFFYYIVIEIIR